MTKTDYSEYTPNEYEKYRALGHSNEYIEFSVFDNKAYFDKTGKSFRLNIDDSNEFFRISELVNEIKRKHPDLLEVQLFEDDSDKEAEYDKECEEYNSIIKATASEKYNVDFENAEHLVYLAQCNEEDIIVKPFINVYSGTNIFLNFGEGILDFIYADFNTPLTEIYGAEKEFESLLENADENDEELRKLIDEYEINSENDKTDKIYEHAQLLIRDFSKFMFTFELIRDIAYSSLYSAICPPMFKTSTYASKDIKRYGIYILNLQREYRNLVEFCYDEDYYPSVLGEMTPVERYSLYRSIRQFPNTSSRIEEFRTGIAVLGEYNPPYSYDLDSMYQRFHEPVITDDLIDLAKQYKMCAKDLAAMMAIPRGISVCYNFSSLSDILELEFTKMLEENIRFRKCKRCGRYFIMKGNYDTNYCDRVEPGTSRTCKDLAAQENYKKKTEGNEAIALYHKYYKRYAARVKVRQIKEADFKKWKYDAIVKRDECSDGKISANEFIEWLEACFPNRKKKE